MNRRILILAGATVALAGACMPQSATVQEESTYNLYQVFFWTAAVVAAIVYVMTTLAIIRFRRRRDQRDDELPTQTRENRPLEVAWTAFPFLTVFVLFVLTLVTLNTVDAMPPNPAATIDVTAFRWSWTFVYPGKGVTITGATGQPPEMVVPAGQNLHIVLTSADVDHAFWIPKFLFKRDAIPGITNEFNFTIKQPGTYSGQCAEYCGLYHDEMTFTVRAVPPAEYQSWLVSQRAGASASPSPSALPSAAQPSPVTPKGTVGPTYTGAPSPAAASPVSPGPSSSPTAFSAPAGSQP